MAAAISRHGFDWRIPRFLYVLYVSFYAWVYVQYVCMYVCIYVVCICGCVISRIHTQIHSYKLSCLHTYIDAYVCCYVYMYVYIYMVLIEVENLFFIDIGCMYCGGSGYYMSPVDFIRNPLLWITAISHYKV